MEFSFLPIPPWESTCALQHWTGDLNPWSRSVSLELQLPQPQSPTQMLPPYSIDPRLASPTICWCLFREVNKHNGAREPHVWGADVTLGSAADNQSADASQAFGIPVFLLHPFSLNSKIPGNSAALSWIGGCRWVAAIIRDKQTTKAICCTFSISFQKLSF